MPQQPVVLDPASNDRHAEHQVLRARGPAARVVILGVDAWAVTSPTLLRELLNSDYVSKDGRRHWPEFDRAVRDWPLALWVAVENMFTAYGGDHRRLRRLVAPALTARKVAPLTAHIEQLVHGLLDELDRTAPSEPVDLRDRFAYPLSIEVISHLMGLPADQQQPFRRCVDAVFSTTLTAEQEDANAAALYGILNALITNKRRRPGDDLTSHLIAARDVEGDGSALSEGELRDTLLLMVSAGYETTVNVIDQAVTALLVHPAQRLHIRNGRATWEDVVEETLRLEPAAKHMPLRFALRDISLPGGQVIAKGDAILASFAAANRHPNWYERPDEFDITRAAQDHLAFGHGVHFCLGAPLARLEVATALRALFERFPDLRLATPAEQLRPLASLISNGHREVPVFLHAAA